MTTGRNQNPPLPPAYLIGTAVLCGALVMVLEVLGSRVVGPFFGVSLFVWTSLITVTLVALALGYAVGGILADKRGHPDWLYAIIGLAGIAVLAIPLIKTPVLKACLALGLRAGALASSFLLFGPSLFLLGCVSPYIVRLAAREMQSLGRTVGLLSALSTFGSFIGTVTTGFILIAALGVNKIFMLVGFLLLLLAVIWFFWFRRRWTAALCLGLPFLLLPPAAPPGKILPDGTEIIIRHSQDSYYGNVKVVDYRFPALGNTRELTIDGFVQGGVDMDSGLSVYPYAYFMEIIPTLARPGGRNCLVIGLGAGIVPLWYQAQGIATDVVDIDPLIPAAAERYFGFRLTKGSVYIDDARHFLLAGGKRYDYVILDVFNGDTTPGHLLSREALDLVKKRMEPGAILAINMAGSLKTQNAMTASVIETLEAVFKTVVIYPLFDAGGEPAYGNMAVFAADAEAVAFDRRLIYDYPIHPMADRPVKQFINRTFSFPPGTPSMVLSDDYNPIDVRDSWLRESIRRDLLRATDWDVLL